GGGGQFPGAREVVGVDVGLGDAGDGHAVARGQFEVVGDIATGVDDISGVLCLAADEVAGLGKVFVIDTVQQPEGITAVVRSGGVCENHHGIYPTGYQVIRWGVCKGAGGAGLAVLWVPRDAGRWRSWGWASARFDFFDTAGRIWAGCVEFFAFWRVVGSIFSTPTPRRRPGVSKLCNPGNQAPEKSHLQIAV